MDAQRAAGRHVRRPQLVVAVGGFGAVAAVDEQQGQGRGPEATHGGRVAHDRDHRPLQPGVEHGPTEPGQGVHAPHLGVDQVGFVPLPAGLVLLGPPVVVQGEEHHPGLLGRGAEPDRRLAAVRPDLEERGIGNGDGRLPRRRPQGVALVGGHEPTGGHRGGVHVGGHGGDRVARHRPHATDARTGADHPGATPGAGQSGSRTTPSSMPRPASHGGTHSSANTTVQVPICCLV